MDGGYEHWLKSRPLYYDSGSTRERVGEAREATEVLSDMIGQRAMRLAPKHSQRVRHSQSGHLVEHGAFDGGLDPLIVKGPRPKLPSEHNPRLEQQLRAQTKSPGRWDGRESTVGVAGERNHRQLTFPPIAV
jgi:hypothetical protein